MIVPEVGACTGAEITPWLAPISCPFNTLSPTCTTGLAVAPTCCSKGTYRRSGMGKMRIARSAANSLRLSGCTPPRNLNSFMMTSSGSVLQRLQIRLVPIPAMQCHRDRLQFNRLGRAHLFTLSAGGTGFAEHGMNLLCSTHNGVGRTHFETARATDAQFFFDFGDHRDRIFYP